MSYLLALWRRRVEFTFSISSGTNLYRVKKGLGIMLLWKHFSLKKLQFGDTSKYQVHHKKRWGSL